MLGKIRKILREQKGFTLVELMTVLVILSIILDIGVPNYLRIQAQAEYDADRITIDNIARTAEVYMVQKDVKAVSLLTLIENEIFNGDIVLNRSLGIIDGQKVSVKNDTGRTLEDFAGYSFELDSDTGKIKEYGTVVYNMIGPPVY